LLAEARFVGIRIVELDVFSVNMGARRLYERLGFEEVGVVPRKIMRNGQYFDVAAMYADLGTDKSTLQPSPDV
jgi:RimJ/RimL family protein N-acetyltransferase